MFGVIGPMQCMAAELAPQGVRINALCPEPMATDMIRKLFADRATLRGLDPAGGARQAGAAHPRRPSRPLDQFAETYVYLASDLSRHMTGQFIAVNGGWMVG